MSLKVSQATGDYEIVPEGQYIARCYKVVDMGTQDVSWEGQTKQQPKIIIYWEILDDKLKMDDGRPFSISKTYTASLDDRSNLYKDLVAWRGKQFSAEELIGFDISKLLGAYCQIQVAHQESNGKTYANINALMNTKERPTAVNDTVMFDIDNPDMEIFNTFPTWLKDKIRSSAEWDDTKEELSSVPGEQTKLEDSKDVKIEDVDDDVDLSDIPF